MPGRNNIHGSILARTQQLLLLATAMVSLLVGCGGGGGDNYGNSVVSVPSLLVFIDDPVRPETTNDSFSLFGRASCDSCPPTEYGIGYCPAPQPVQESPIEISWSNHTNGTNGIAPHEIDARCTCVFSTCVTYYSDFWAALRIPVAIGDNHIEVRATDPSGRSGVASITLTRLPSAVSSLDAAGGKGQVTLSWTPVAGATFYNLYWATSRNVTPANGTRIPGISSPFTHTGLSDDVAHYYTVTAVIDGFEGPASAVAMATPGWQTETVAVTTPTTLNRATSIATDSVGNAHIHYSFDEHIQNSVTMRNYYATNALGTWAPSQIDRTADVNSSIALDTSGVVHLTYIDFDGLKHATYTAGTWVEELADSAGKCAASLALDSTDNAHIITYWDLAPGTSIRHVTNSSGSWTSSNDIDIPYVLNLCPSRLPPSAAVDATSGAVHFAYPGSHPNYGLKYATNLGGTWSVSTPDTGNIYDVSIGIDINGKAHIAYANNLLQLKYAQNVSGTWIVETLFTGVIDPALAIDSAGHVHLSYIAGGELRYATNADGNWRVVPIDTSDIDVTGGGATDTAIALDPQGNVHISYVRGGNIMYASNK